MAVADSYKQFIEEVKEQRHLSTIVSLLNWDEQTYLPVAAAAGRGDQMSLMSRIIHQRLTAPWFVDLVSKLEQETKLSNDEKICVQQIARSVHRATKVPETLVGAISKAESVTQHRWIEARKANSFASVQSSLGELLALKREYADALGTSDNRYETLLDTFEQGLTVAAVNQWFGELSPALKQLTARFAGRFAPLKFAGASPSSINDSPGTFPRPKQDELFKQVLSLMGFDQLRGRVDPTVHPFCLDAGFDDVRLTIRYADDDFAPGLYALMHEAGHGLYEQGYSRDHAGTPLAQYSTMAVHESQSRLWENMIGRSAAFMQVLAPLLRKLFPETLAGIDESQLLTHVNRVERGLNRVEADEVSYGLHVIIRFELEQLLVADKLPLADLPAAWNERYQSYLGVSPANDVEGVLQDIHWYIGYFGYFPTYLIGSCYAAELFAALERDIPDLNAKISLGDLTALRLWLVEKIHSQGQRYIGAELIERATGVVPSAAQYLNYLNSKFG